MLKSFCRIGTFLALLAVAPLSSQEAAPATVTLPAPAALPGVPAYGMCAHVTRGEHNIAKKEFVMMREAGIKWVRSDFDWAHCEVEPGKWKFSHLDETVAWAEEAGINVLPILDYDTKWATPAYKHLDAWTNYVRTVVTRYKDRLRVWEVWNEENLDGMWREKPNGANYATLLAATYKTIKEVDPGLTVLFGGTAGVPLGFIEDAYKAGAAQAFDVMAVHPYRYPGSPEETGLIEEMQQLRALMTKYGAGNKPVWITEIGWPTHGGAGVVGTIVKAGWSKLPHAQKDVPLAVLDDPAYNKAIKQSWRNDLLQEICTDTFAANRITLQDLLSLSPEKFPALLLPLTEHVPGGVYFDAIERYVREGGVLLTLQGVPLYYEMIPEANGSWTMRTNTESIYQRLHLGWEASWSNPKAPDTVSGLKAPADLADTLRLSTSLHATRYLTGSRLKEGDKMEVLISGQDKGYNAVAAALYRFNSDLKGGVIAVTFMKISSGSSPLHQARMLPRAYFCALSAGVEKIFWYELQSSGTDATYNEDHFGITTPDLTPKPAFNALLAMGKFRPGLSQRLEGAIVENGVYRCGWKCPDGTTGWALWTLTGEKKIAVKVSGAVSGIYDLFGAPINIAADNGVLTLELNEGVTYIMGPTALTPQK